MGSQVEEGEEINSLGGKTGLICIKKKAPSECKCDVVGVVLDIISSHQELCYINSPSEFN